MFKKNYCQSSCIFLPFLKAPAEKLMSHSQISFESWLNKLRYKLHFFFFENLRYGGLKSWFSDCLTFSWTWTKVIVQQQAHFRQFLKVTEKIWYNILKSVLKVGKMMWTLNYTFFLVWLLGKKVDKKPGKLTFLSRCCIITFKRKEKILNPLYITRF